MSDSESSGSGLKVAGGVGAAILALLAGFAKFGDDALRLVIGHADDVGRGVMQHADDVGRGLAHHADEAAGGAMHHADEFGQRAFQHGDEFSRTGLPQFKDPSRITSAADDAVGGHVHVPARVFNPSTYGRDAAGAAQEQKEKGP